MAEGNISQIEITQNSTSKTFTIGKTTYIEISHHQLKTLKDGKNLEEGAFYRITDYEAHVANGNMICVPRNFDIIVQATSPSTLDENARTIKKESSNDKSIDKANSWEIKYCIDDDKNRFGWAVNNGHGVIYYMKDEYNNVAPYDFKSIMLKPKNGLYNIGNNFFYTFGATSSSNESTDQSSSGNVYNNYIAPYYDENGVQQLNYIIITSKDKNASIKGNYFGPNCHDIRIGGNECHNNTFKGGNSHIYYGRLEDRNSINGNILQPEIYIYNSYFAEGIFCVCLSLQKENGIANTVTYNVNIHRGVHGGKFDTNSSIKYTVDSNNPILLLNLNETYPDRETNFSMDENGWITKWTT